MHELPIISIVTPTYNQGAYIEETINSVLSQNYPNLEYIIIDGGSTDGTVGIIRKYEKHLKFWVSEPDKGQANAINKGLQHCTGEIFNWLNSDDYLAPGALQAIAQAFENPKTDAVAGQTIYFDEKGFQPAEQLAKLTPEGLLFWLPGVVFIQPGLWLRTKYIEKCGGLDENYHYSFDSDMIIRYLSLTPNVKYISNVLVYFRLHSESKTVSQKEKFKTDRISFVTKLATLSDFKTLQALSIRWLEKEYWSNFLKSSISENKPKLEIVVHILYGIIKKPLLRMNRKSLGAIKSIIQK